MERKRIFLLIVVSLSLGVALTFLSKLYSKQVVAAGGLIGISVTGYGFPFFWLRETKVVFPEPRPATQALLWVGFATDFIFWFLVSLALSSVFIVGAPEP